MPTISLSTAKDHIWDRLERNDQFYTATQVTRAFNNAVKTLNLFTGFYTAKASIVTEDGRGIYRVPSTILVTTKVKVDGRDLDPLGFRDLVAARPTWMKETTSTEGYNSATWTAVGLHRDKKVIIHPAPAVGGKVLEFTGVGEPAALSLDSDVLTTTSEFADILYSLAAHELMMKCGGAVARDAMFLYQGFLNRMKELKRFRAKVNPRFWIEATQKTEDRE